MYLSFINNSKLGSATHSVEVEITKETEKALQFTAIQNPKHFIWLPKMGVKEHWYTNNDISELIGYKLQMWITLNGWQSKFFRLYAETES